MCREPTVLERQRLARSRIKGWMVARPSACARDTRMSRVVFQSVDGAIAVLSVGESEEALGSVLAASGMAMDDDSTTYLKEDVQ